MSSAADKNLAGELLASQQKEARDFVEFVLRHTWPERAKAHGHKVVYEIIKYHPFAQAYGPTQASEDGDE